MRDAHVFMAPKIREPVEKGQRLSVTEIRDNLAMPRPPELKPMSTIGARVRWWREYRGLSRAQLSKAARMGLSTLSDLELDRQKGTSKLHLVAAALKLNPHYLETDKGEPEVGFSQPPPDEPEAWPFPDISPREFAALSRAERHYAQTKLKEVLAEMAADRKATKQTG